MKNSILFYKKIKLYIYITYGFFEWSTWPKMIWLTMKMNNRFTQ
jgi:hypothetical protein